jgi:hypothetical protein
MTARRVAAALIVVCAISGFVMGVAGTPPKGRLPGDTGKGGAGAPVLKAQEYQALNTDPMADAPKVDPAPEKSAETLAQEAKAAADAKKARAQAEAAKLADAEKAMPYTKVDTPSSAAVQGDKVGDVLDAVTPPAPPADEVPH